MTYQEWLHFAGEVLTKNRDNDPFLNVKNDCYLLLQTVTKRSKASILAFSETVLTEGELQQLAPLLMRRAKGEPIAYILGEKAFWSLSLKVSAQTLIPRPDTEILVEHALDLAKQRITSAHFSGELSILDLGTGTGAIALALAAELTPLTQKCGINLSILGVDCIAEVVALAKANAKQNGLMVNFLQSAWFDALKPENTFDLIVSNPPYIDKNDPHLAQGDVRFEPLSALVAAEEGYADIRHIIEQAPLFLKPQGALLLEHGWQQAEKVRAIFEKNVWHDVMTFKDYSGNERVTLGCWR